MNKMALRDLENVLDLREVRVDSYAKKALRIEIHVSLKSMSARCPVCNLRSTRKHSEKRIKVRDLSCFGRRVYLSVPRRRFKCRKCAKPFTERLSFLEFGTGFTKRYEDYLFDQCRERSFVVVEQQEGISDTQIQKMYAKRLSRESAQNGPLNQLRVLGIDEIAVKKGHRNYVCVLTDIDKKQVIEVLDDRLKDTVKAYLLALPVSVQKSVRYVSIDMWEGYYQAVVEALPKRVKVVIDRFHVMKHLNAALTKCRRELQRAAESKDARDELKGLRWVLVKNECDLNEEEAEKLATLYRICPELRTCHRLKEEFREIFDQEQTRPKAVVRLKRWKKRVRQTGLKSLNRFVDTFENWEDWILNYFSSGKVTNGVVEGINTKIKLIKRRGYGYRNNGNFKQRILVECGIGKEKKSGTQK